MAVSQGWSHATGNGFDQIQDNFRKKSPVSRTLGRAKMPLNHEPGQAASQNPNTRYLITLIPYPHPKLTHDKADRRGGSGPGKIRPDQVVVTGRRRQAPPLDTKPKGFAA
jgi:hypothetical protein